jgi:5'-nucleotidase
MSRGVYCNRTLNMRAIKAIGYDMDYTLVDYHVEAWEQRAYERARDKLAAHGWPVAELRYDPEAVIRGLCIDVELGNLVKPNRFGFITRAVHGTRELEFDQLRATYTRTVVDLSQPRWVFLNTLFSYSEACLYGQLVDLVDAGGAPEPLGYRDLYTRVQRSLDEAHVEGELKAEIIADPEKYVVLDPDLPLTLLDQRASGKKLMLITNSEWHYTRAMMEYTLDRYLTPPMKWRDLFDVVIVVARKPDFFTARNPIYEVVTEDGLVRPMRGDLRGGALAYLGGSAEKIEKFLGCSGDEILYVGDHMFGDVQLSNKVLRWRTALILRELDDEVAAITSFRDTERALGEKMAVKEGLEADLSKLRLALQRKQAGYGPQPDAGVDELKTLVTETRNRLLELDAEIVPLARAASQLHHRRWGLLTRAGNDKSHLARQVERYADIYTSRVSNLLYVTPFVYLRSARGSLPHDPSTPPGPPMAPVVKGPTPPAG